MSFNKILGKLNIFNILLYFIIVSSVLFSLIIGMQIFKVNQFFEDIELKTLDLRFKLPIKSIKHNEDIVILAIDDNSLEVLEDSLGRWPWSRDVHALISKELIDAGAQSVVFDLMFIGRQKGFEKEDQELIDTVKEYDEVYLAMNFDRREESNPIDIIQNVEDLAIKVKNFSDLDFSEATFTNVRAILPELLTSTTKIGIINHSRDNDSISRRNHLLFKYHGKYYPYLALKVAIDVIAQREGRPIKELIITKDNYLVIGNTNIPLQKDGKMLVNWYGPSQTYDYIPIWKVIKSIHQVEQGDPPILDLERTFKNKIILVGATASSLFDIKTTPFSRVHPGVEFQATVLDNVISGDFLTRAPFYVNVLISLILFILTGACVLKIRSGMATFIITLSIALAYLIVASMVFSYLYVWIDVMFPMLVISVTFTVMYVIKYVIKSKDFEYTYKLAVTDGLTGLHNHRFFQERMVNNIERCRRYSTNFSLLLLDIDFFKKFNDNYGHQAGDAVLKQVAETLKKSVRSSDLVARYGGEEMAIVLDNADTEEAIIIANKICKTVAEKPFKLSETIDKHVTITLGVATYPKHGDSPTALIEFADKCLYRGKENGRNQVGPLYGTEEESNSQTETSQETDDTHNNIEFFVDSKPVAVEIVDIVADITLDDNGNHREKFTRLEKIESQKSGESKEEKQVS
jgi:diguanylate cyclase (GGDEF)-like protein